MTTDARVRRLHLAFDLHEAGVELMRQRLRREHPTCDERQIANLLGKWLRERPGAEHGDCQGIPCPFPRSGGVSS